MQGEIAPSSTIPLLAIASAKVQDRAPVSAALKIGQGKVDAMECKKGHGCLCYTKRPKPCRET